MKELLKENVKKLLENNIYPETIKEILNLVISEDMYKFDIQQRYKQKINDSKALLASVVLDYIELCLKDGLITSDEMQSTKILKMFFNIEEKDFYDLNLKERVSFLLSIELEKLYEDKVIDENEALTKVDLQELFGLCYDDFYEIDKVVAKNAVQKGANKKDFGTYFNL